MGFRLPASIISTTKRALRLQSVVNKNQSGVPSGHIAVYVGDDEKKWHVIPLSYLDHPLFHDLLRNVEEEYGFSHTKGGLTFPCNEDAFIDLAYQLDQSL